MGSLTPVEELTRHLAHWLPSAHVTVDAPDAQSGNWFIDVEYKTRTAVVEWRPRRGFGVSVQKSAYGEGPEIIFPSARAAADYLSTHLQQTNRATVLVLSTDEAWRRLLRDELAKQHVAADVLAAYGEAVERLQQRAYEIVIVDLPTTSLPDDYRELHSHLSRSSAVVVAVGTTTAAESSTTRFEAFVRKDLPAARIASIVESLTVSEAAS